MGQKTSSSPYRACMVVGVLSKTFAPRVGFLTICLWWYPDLRCLSGSEFKSRQDNPGIGVLFKNLIEASVD